MYKGDTIPGILTAVFGFTIAIYTLLEDTMRYKAQSSDGVPGAGFFPVILGLILGVLGITLIIRGLRKHGAVQYFKMDPEIRENLKMLLLSVGGILVFFVLWQLTGQFIPCALVLCLFLNRVFQRSWKFNILYSVIFIAFIYLAFVQGFSIQFNM